VGAAGVFCECVVVFCLKVDCFFVCWLYFSGDCVFLFCVLFGLCSMGFDCGVLVFVAGGGVLCEWFCARMFVLGWCVFVCCEGVCFFPGLCVVCVFVFSRLVVRCALCWGIVWPGCSEFRLVM